MPAHPLNIVAGLFAAGLLACAPAHAGHVNTSANLSNIQFQLIDLDLTDNITPSITFQNKQSGGQLSYVQGAEGGSNSFSGFDTFSAAYTNGSVSATSTATSLQAQAQARTSPVAQGQELTVSVSARQELSFTLSPSTRLIFSAQGDAFVDQADIDWTSPDASIGAWIETNINGVSVHDESYSSITSSQGKRSRFLQGSVDTGTAIATGMLTASASVNFHDTGTIGPVPEPETYGMLMAGLLVLGGVARRKARKA
ncbi:MAG TPA: PEP-CTERM sorting domain-containing protein [Telluria sp.]|jgi:hypothetical protein